MSRDACEYKLNDYVQAGTWKPKYYGYTTYDEAEAAWDFYLETRIVPCAPANGGVLATPVPLAQPTIPQRNRNLNLNRIANVQGTASPRSPYNSPSPAHHGSPSLARVLPFSQPPPSLTAAQLVEDELFFIVIVGYSPGVYVSL